MSIGHSPLRRGLLAATATLAAGAVVAGVSVAGAAQDRDASTSPSAGGPVLHDRAGKPACAANESADVTIQTGDTVTWDFTGTPRATCTTRTRRTTCRRTRAGRLRQLRTQRERHADLQRAGRLQVRLRLHPTMKGTITVEGEPVETTPTPTPTATPTATPTPHDADADPDADRGPRPTRATPDDHTTTPAPGHAAAKDTELPRLASAGASNAPAARLRFWLSEPATVAIDARRKGSRTVRHEPHRAGARRHARATLRGKAFKKGTYTVSLRATDAMGNRAAAVTTTLRVK